MSQLVGVKQPDEAIATRGAIGGQHDSHAIAAPTSNRRQQWTRLMVVVVAAGSFEIAAQRTERVDGESQRRVALMAGELEGRQRDATCGLG